MSIPITPAQTYRHSGRVPITGLTLAFGILIPVAILVGVIYSFAVVYLPYIKLRGLVTLVYGGSLGAMTGLLCYQLKFRSHWKVSLLTLAVTFVSYYSSWAVHRAVISLYYDGFHENILMMAAFGFHPDSILGWAQFIFHNGIWNTGGGAVDGWEAVAGWVIEALLIWGMAWVGSKAYGNVPFCEDCDQWTEETKDLARLPVAPDDDAWQQFAYGNLDAIKRLKLVPDVSQYVELQLAACPTCTGSDYLSAVGVTLTVNNEGEVQKHENDIVRHLSITHSQKEEIQAFATEMAEAVALMSEEDEGEDSVKPAVESDSEDSA